ncbi:MAG: type II toxin-antitoxin system VapC family toxin [Cyanothece sp. SIO1E1]|nr:type II toxin-antitoxin system VapC family toxin [Cyanothece sp. SIO1E1]
MKLLLDTHTFMWWDSDPNQIPSATLDHLKQPENEVLVSLVSLWEIQIKTQLGKLALRADLANIVRQQQTDNSIILLPISLPHILELDKLPYHHKDPFDRLLIAQSRIESSSIVSRDTAFRNYDCQVIW